MVVLRILHTFKPLKIFFVYEFPNPNYLVLKVGNMLSINNWDMAHNVILQRPCPSEVKVIGQTKWHHQIPSPQKHRSGHQNRHPKWLSLKVIVKDVFLHDGGQRNTFAYISRSNHSRRCFIIYKSPEPSYPVLKFGDNFFYSNWDMVQNVILQDCDLERSQSSVKVNDFSIRPPLFIH